MKAPQAVWMRRAMRAAVVMAAVATASQAAPAQSAPHQSLLSHRVSCRTLWQYNDGAALRACALVANSAAEWDHAMQAMVARGEAVAAEPAPHVDWSRTAVVMLAMGEAARGTRLQVVGASRVGNLTELELHVAMASDGSGE